MESPCRLHGGQAAQPVGVALGGQVQRGVGGVQIGVAGPAIGEAADPDLADDAGQPPLMSRLHPGVGVPVGVDDVAPRSREARRSRLVLEELAQLAPAVAGQPVLQLGVLQPVGLGPAQPGRQGLEAGPGDVSWPAAVIDAGLDDGPPGGLAAR